MQRIGAAIVLAAALALAAPPALRAADGSDRERSPAELALEGIDRLMQALGLFIDTIPQYEAPVVTEEGDIIIRRKRDHAAPPPPAPAEPAPDEGDTTRI